MSNFVIEQPPPEPLLINKTELARLLQISVRSLWRLTSAGVIPEPVRLGGSTRWRSADIHEWVAAGCPGLKEYDIKRRRK